MNIFNKSLPNITEDDIKFLKSQEVLENKTIEYKKELPGNTTSEKKEFLYDVTAFANSSGGIIFFGIEENEGKPISIDGVKIDDIDKVILRFENIIRSGVTPRISNISIMAIELSNSNHIILVQVPNSWSSPHMISYNHSGKFFARNSAGKYQMDAHEIKQAFINSETIVEKIRSFREKRVNEILSGKTPINLGNSAKTILHTIPLEAFKTIEKVNIKWVADNFLHLKPMGGRPVGTNFNLDGVYSYLNWENTKQNAYAQIYRNGIIESASNKLTKIMENGSRKIMGQYFEQEIIIGFGNYLQLYKNLGIESPIFVFLSILNVHDYTMGINHTSRMLRDRFETPIDRDNLLLPEFIFENLSTDNLPEKLKPIFDMVWNSSGWPHSMNYDENGNWIDN